MELPVDDGWANNLDSKLEISGVSRPQPRNKSGDSNARMLFAVRFPCQGPGYADQPESVNPETYTRSGGVRVII